MKRFAFIILNYQSLKETINCIKSIQKMEYEEKYIIVVDNASDNQKEFFETLKKIFQGENSIIYLYSEKNLGYARGNNIGLDYAKKVLKADFACVINPDVIIQHDDFINKCVGLYEQYGYAVLGPQIIKNGKNSNPLGGYIESSLFCMLHYIENYRIYYIKKWNMKRFNLFKNKFWKDKCNKSSMKTDKDVLNKVETYLLSKEMEVQLSGACLIFSPRFLEDFSGFCKDTFLYCEECILACVCYNLGYKLLYSSELAVVHEGGKSMINVEENDAHRQMRVSKIGAHSCRVTAKVYMHKKDKEYLKNCLNPKVSEYYEYFGRADAVESEAFI